MPLEGGGGRGVRRLMAKVHIFGTIPNSLIHYKTLWVLVANCQRYQIILKPFEGGRRRDFENAHQMAGKLWWGIAHFFSEWASNFWRIRRRETEVLVGRWLLILPSCSMRSVGGILRFHIMKVDMCEKDFFRIAMLWSHFEPEAEKPPVVLFHKTYPQFD